MNDLSDVNYDVPLGAVTPHPHTLPPESVLPAHDIPPLHLVIPHCASGARGGGEFSGSEEFVDDILVLTFTVGHI